YPADRGTIGDDEHPYEAGDVRTGAPVKKVALGSTFTCILYAGGNVKCIGANGSGQLGYGHTDPVADEPIDVGDVSLGEPAQDVAAGTTITCALLESGAVRCWGRFTTRCS